MKICFSSAGKDLESKVDQRFGRCPYLVFIDDKEGKIIETIENKGPKAMSGAGISAAQIVVDQDIGTLVTGNIGPNAFNVLNAAGVKIYVASPDLTIKQALDLFNQDKLELVTNPTGPGRSNN